jgi:hypothetical protein
MDEEIEEAIRDIEWKWMILDLEKSLQTGE